MRLAGTETLGKKKGRVASQTQRKHNGKYRVKITESHKERRLIDMS